MQIFLRYARIWGLFFYLGALKPDVNEVNTLLKEYRRQITSLTEYR